MSEEKSNSASDGREGSLKEYNNNNNAQQSIIDGNPLAPSSSVKQPTSNSENVQLKNVPQNDVRTTTVKQSVTVNEKIESSNKSYTMPHQPEVSQTEKSTIDEKSVTASTLSKSINSEENANSDQMTIKACQRK